MTGKIVKMLFLCWVDPNWNYFLIPDSLHLAKAVVTEKSPIQGSVYTGGRAQSAVFGSASQKNQVRAPATVQQLSRMRDIDGLHHWVECSV